MEGLKKQLKAGSPLAALELIVQELIPEVGLEEDEKNYLNKTVNRILISYQIRELIQKPEYYVMGETFKLSLGIDEISLKYKDCTIYIGLSKSEFTVSIFIDISSHHYNKNFNNNLPWKERLYDAICYANLILKY